MFICHSLYLSGSFATAESKTSNANQKSERVPATVIIDRPNCNVVHEQATYEGKWCDNSVPQSTQKPIGVTGFTGFNILHFGTCRQKEYHHEKKGNLDYQLFSFHFYLG